jgi:hypothetical protein
MNSVTATSPDRQLHVILGNLNAHKKDEPWLKAIPPSRRIGVQN